MSAFAADEITPSVYSEQRLDVAVDFTLECEQEVDGRWIAEVSELPGVLAYGESSADAMAKAEVLALRVMADRLEHGESAPVNIR
jgi:predicted RNase H-like HicB family nuclease